MKRLAIITTHPIQYYAPLFRLLNERGFVKPKVFYTWWQAKEKVEDKGFGKTIQWDIPLLEGYEYQFMPTKKAGNKSFFGIDNPDLIPEITKWKPDAILVFGWNYKSHMQVMRHFKGKIPVWFRGDSHLLDETPGFKTLARRIFLNWVYRHVDKAFYVGTNNKNYYLKHGLKEDQLVFAPHAIDNDRFFDNNERKYEEKATEWRQKLGYTANDIVILFAGKFENKKAPDLLIKAIKQLNMSTFSQNPVHLLLAGNGEIENELKLVAGDDKHIKFLPFQNQSQMPVLYRICNIFCLPSQGPGETWGLAVNEVMASSRPVIVTDKVGCAVDLVKYGINGFVFPSKSSEGLLDLIKTCAKDKNKLSEMRKKSFETIQDWSINNICVQLEQELQAI